MSGNFRFPPPPPPPPSARTHSSQARDHAQRAPIIDGQGGYRPQYNNRGSDPRGGSFHGPEPRRQFEDNRSGLRNHQPSGNFARNERAQSHPNFGSPLHATRDQSSHLPARLESIPSHHQHHSQHRQQQQPRRDFSAYKGHSAQGRLTHGVKRKVDSSQVTNSSQKDGERRNSAIAPVVPRFGSPVVVAQPAAKPSKKSANTLGLTPSAGAVIYSESSNDEDSDQGEYVDEEALYAELGAKLTFEHGGEIVSLTSAADLSHWLETRRQNWPTEARKVQKAVRRVEIGEVRKSLLDESYRLLSMDKAESATTTRSTHKDRTSRSAVSAVDASSEGSQELRSQPHVTEIDDAAISEDLQHVEDDDQEKPSKQEDQVAAEGRPARNSRHSMAHGPIEQSTIVDPPTTDFDYEEEVNEEDDGPEEEPSKVIQETSIIAPLCKYYVASGACRNSVDCRFRHDGHVAQPVIAARPADNALSTARSVPVAKSHERQSIRDVLLSQQKREEDLLALKVVKYLGEAGFFC